MIEQLHAGAAAVLGRLLLGIYMIGSLAASDFGLHNSDIDCVIVPATAPTPATLAALVELHIRMRRCFTVG